MRYLVTGAAGFVGSHLCDALLSGGQQVIGVDAFIPYYPRYVKESNISHLRYHPNFTFYERDLRTDDLAPLLEGVDVVYHLAGMPGLLESWKRFDLYLSCNIEATYYLLEAILANGGVSQLIYASTSSVYGEYVVGPETTPLNPVSPYGITKMGGEQLVQTYGQQFGVPYNILRYFSVYGPRQRPDMGYQIFIERILNGQPITIFGDGTQRRGNTYIDDLIQGTLLASEQFIPGTIYNIGGTDEVSVNDVIAILEDITGQQAVIEHGPERKGEQSRTLADISRAQQMLGFSPGVTVRDGLAAQVAWHLERVGVR